jgi:probable HAF family extracellular repeat protein
MISFCRLMISLFLAFLVTSSALAGHRFEILDLNDLNETDIAFLFSINNDGVITGTSNLGNPGTSKTVATTWINGRATSLGLVPGDHYSEGATTNLIGQSVGVSNFVEKLGHIIRIYPTAVFFENGQVTELESLVQSGEDWTLMYANDINDFGQIIGWGRDNSTEEIVSFLFEDGILTELGTLGGYATQPYAMNNAGHVIGQSWTSAGQNHAFIWEDGIMTDLGTFGGRDSRALSVNEFGQVVGGSEKTGGRERAVLWADGRSIDLGSLGGEQANANGINNQGQVVGFSTDENWYAHMFLWEDSLMINPLDHIPPGGGWGGRANALDINDAGQIVASAFRNGYDAPAVLTPVELILSELTPGVAGEVNSINIRGLTPGELVQVVYGSSTGMTQIGGCPGATILISEPRKAGTATADNEGYAELEVYVPEKATGQTFRIQVVQGSECLESNVVTVTFD